MSFMRFTIRDLLWLTVVAAAVIGCKSRPAASPAAVAPASHASLNVTKEQAIAIVENGLQMSRLAQCTTTRRANCQTDSACS
jgi:hypothetical protein